MADSSSDKKILFNSDTNILGSIPDYAAMIQYAVLSLTNTKDTDFSFRTLSTWKRFTVAINRNILTFKNKEHQQIVFDALSSEELRMDQKLIVLFWQIVINNDLFAFITENYYMKSVYAGRISLHPDEIMSYLYELRRDFPNELTWTEETLKTIASKYLTLMKKLGLAEGNHTKEIKYPNIGDELFVILVLLALALYPDEPTEKNPLFKYSFLDTASLISRMKSIKFTSYWSLKQLGNQIIITLNANE